MEEKDKVKLEELPEFREGEEEFIEALSQCPACSLKLALELLDSQDQNDREMLKKLLTGLGKHLLKQERQLESKGLFPIMTAWISDWLRGEAGLGIFPRILKKWTEE